MNIVVCKMLQVVTINLITETLIDLYLKWHISWPYLTLYDVTTTEKAWQQISHPKELPIKLNYHLTNNKTCTWLALVLP